MVFYFGLIIIYCIFLDLTVFILGFFIWYQKSKSPAMQTLLDLQSIDTGILFLFLISLWDVAVILSQLITLGQGFLFVYMQIFHALLCCSLVSLLATILIKIILVFNSTLINDISDSKIIYWTRVLTFFISGFIFVADQYTNNGSQILMMIVSGDSNSRR